MATVEEIRGFIEETYSVKWEEGSSLVSINFDLGNGRSQLVMVGVIGKALVAASPFAKISDISADQALSISNTHKPVTLLGDSYYGHSSAFPLENLQPDEVLHVIEFITQIADDSERELGLGDAL